MKKSSFNFLENLKENNNHEWVESHLADLNDASNDFEKLIAELITALSKFDHHLMGLKASDCVFPLERDLEISRFEVPFKTHMGAYIAMGGRKSDFAGYYVQVQPGNSFLGGGMYAPSSAVLRKLRQEIDFNPEEIKSILEEVSFVREFNELMPNKYEGAPQGFPKDHRDIELLKYKGFFGIHELSEEEVMQPEFVENAVRIFKSIFPLNKFLNETFIN